MKDNPEITRVCKHCGLEKKITSFVETMSHYKGKTYRSYKKICNTCKAKGYRLRNPDKERTRAKTYRDNNPEVVAAGNRRRCIQQSQRKQELKKKVLDELNKHSCQDCGYDDIRAISFHHRDPKTKNFNICHSLLRKLIPFDVIVEEAKKCDVLCLNCHQIRHSLT